MLTRPASRIDVVDALRGFAILSIMLLHNIEHFDFYYFPEDLPAWMKSIDKGIWDSLFFLFGGKSYAIFALLFGFTFFIQMEKQARLGADFRLRFMWRLLLLLLFGVINTAFYQGDILSLYAVIGFSLVPVARLNNRTVFIIAFILMLQPYDWFNVYKAMQPGYVPPEKLSNHYFAQTGYMADGSFIEVVKGNLTTGKKAVLYWYHENGRYFQTAALFMLGMLLARQKRFIYPEINSGFWLNVLGASLVWFGILFYLRSNLSSFISNQAVAGAIESIIATWSNFAFMLILVSLFVLLYYKTRMKQLLCKLSPLGKMSLSNYVMQSIAGTILYYGWGFGLYKYTGAAYCLLIGLVLFLLQLWFCRWWLQRHQQGPLEKLWHQLTWIASNR